MNACRLLPQPSNEETQQITEQPDWTGPRIPPLLSQIFANQKQISSKLNDWFVGWVSQTE